MTVDTTNQFDRLVSVASGNNAVTVTATDPSGNAASQIYDVSVASNAATFTFDANGNLTDDGTRSFEWDARNQLVAVVVGTHRSEFTYDGLQRRVRMVEKESGVVQTDTHVLWCGVVICEERAANGTTVVRRAFDEGEQLSGTAQFFAKDHLGSVTEVTNNSGALLGRYAFDPWGRRTLVAGADVTTVGYTGHWIHATSETYLSLYRAYDPALGRWLSEDPAGPLEGPNPYLYVLNRSLSRVDPHGLWSFAAEYNTTGAGLNGNIWGIEPFVDLVFNEIAGRDAVVTFTTNGKHSRNSLHYDGDAIDIRTRDLTKADRELAAQRLRDVLGEGFDVLDEGDHIHVEWDPRTLLGSEGSGGNRRDRPQPPGANQSAPRARCEG